MLNRKEEDSKSLSSGLLDAAEKFTRVIDLVRMYPNNMELGKKVRQLIEEYNRNKDSNN